jgi:hypothetical protein
MVNPVSTNSPQALSKQPQPVDQRQKPSTTSTLNPNAIQTPNSNRALSSPEAAQPKETPPAGQAPKLDVRA